MLLKRTPGKGMRSVMSKTAHRIRHRVEAVRVSHLAFSGRRCFDNHTSPQRDGQPVQLTAHLLRLQSSGTGNSACNDWCPWHAAEGKQLLCRRRHLQPIGYSHYRVKLLQ
jgi:hypothetical protein